ncbi:hypothetical protein ACSTK4_23610, partial [Vibrio parahaemolyticus]
AVKIDFVVERSDSWLVFVGDYGSVWFDWGEDVPVSPDLRRAINRSVELQSYDMSELTDDQRTSYRWLIGNGLAAALSGDHR